MTETPRSPSEQETTQARKLESIGRLSAGITHEINTPMHYLDNHLTFLTGAFADLIALQQRYRGALATLRAGKPLPSGALTEIEQEEQRVDPAYLEDEIRRALDQSLEGTDHVTKIVLALKDFAHPSPAEYAMADINRGLTATVTICRHEWKRPADLKLDLADDLPMVWCSRDALNQVFLNLIVNAAHAIKAKIEAGIYDRGTITVSTRAVGDGVEIRVTDDGTGIAPENHDKIFKPFFTTKGAGQGTGQGLTLIHDIVTRKHQGAISFTTEPGQGTTFTVRLPVRPTEPRKADAP